MRHSFRGMRTCPKCGKRLNWIDWANHKVEHMTEEEQVELRLRTKEAAEEREAANRQSEKEEFEMWRKLGLGE